MQFSLRIKIPVWFPGLIPGKVITLCLPKVPLQFIVIYVSSSLKTVV